MPSWRKIQWNLVEVSEWLIGLDWIGRKKGKKGHTSQNKDNESNQCGIAHIQHGPRDPPKADSSCPEQQSVEEHVAAGHASTAKCPPMPLVVLATEQEVDQQHGRCSSCDDHQSVAQEQESKHVIDLVRPQRCHDKVQFHKDRPERKNAGQEHGGHSTQSPLHRGDLPRDLVGLGRSFNGLDVTITVSMTCVP